MYTILHPERSVDGIKAFRSIGTRRTPREAQAFTTEYIFARCFAGVLSYICGLHIVGNEKDNMK